MFTFKTETSESVKAAINRAYNSGTRVRVWYGNTVTGEAWLDEYDVTGEIGCSTGVNKIPLLIKNSRSSGGGALMDNCIVRIDNIGARSTMYKHPTFTVGHLEECVPASDNFLEAVSKGYETIAQFTKPGQAKRWIAFMKGERYSK